MREFSLTGFATFCGELAIVKEANRHALERGADIVETEAKRVIGTYDYDWSELAESTRAERVRLGFSENEPGLRTGAMRDSIGTTIRADDLAADIGSNDDHLVYFELGTSKQPARPVLMGAAVHTEEKVADIVGRTMVAHLSGETLPKE